MSVRSVLATVLVLGGVVAGVAALPSAAGGATEPVQGVSASGLAGLGGGINAFQVDFAATRAADGTVRGNFRASGLLTGVGVAVPVPVVLAGPVTCLTVRGATAGLLYPLSAVEPASLRPLLGGTSVLITVTAPSGGRSAKIGFLGPIPNVVATTCAPSAAPFTLQGTASVTGG